MKKLLVFCTFCSVLSALAYTSEDTSNANYLADQQIVTKQTMASKYRLDDKILRQEVIGMALRVKGITLPENYTCKKYFADATKNDWVCRAVELAADNGIISRSNKYANPSKYVTRAEALAILWTASNMDQKLSTDWQITSGLYDAYIIYDDANNWQNELIEKARYLKIISPATYQVKIQIPSMHGEELHVQFYPNRSATRAEVFVFAKNIITSENLVSGIEKYGITDYEENYKGEFDHDVSDYAFGPEVPAYGEETKMTRVCRLNLLERSEESDEVDFVGDFISRAKGNSPNKNTPILIHLSGSDKIPTWEYETEFAGPYGTTNVFMKNGDALEISSWGYDCVGLLDLTGARSPRAFDVLKIYYNNLVSWDIGSAYSMRSPAGVSLATFESWYQNTDSVTFREDTLEELDPLEGSDPTYEFLVDMIENGVKSTYKVVSRVNLEKFTIENISSVKQ